MDSKRLRAFRGGEGCRIDAIVDNREPSRPFRFHIDFVDPDHASRDSDGSIRMPRIELDECLRRYG